MSEHILQDAETQDSENKTIQEDVLDIYEDLLQTVWTKIVPTLGTATVATIMQRSINRTSAKHPFLKHLTVSDPGFDFTDMVANINDVNVAEMKEGFKGLVASLFDILAKLTGNILIRQLEREVEGFEVL